MKSVEAIAPCLFSQTGRAMRGMDAIATCLLFTKNLILNRTAIALFKPLQQLRRHQTLRKKYSPQNNQQPKNN